ncbi:hypothetical protein Cni_G26656 [Canna indica]|uniref:Uncharacterized protein n=1 Tax=Canna indica TaxID=4628 RepID=A0AAQ3QQK9_9LILI|nr:hypothetical protein Cni_G26656 [Canna indica]
MATVHSPWLRDEPLPFEFFSEKELSCICERVGGGKKKRKKRNSMLKSIYSASVTFLKSVSDLTSTNTPLNPVAFNCPPLAAADAVELLSGSLPAPNWDTLWPTSRPFASLIKLSQNHPSRVDSSVRVTRFREKEESESATVDGMAD